MYEWDIFEGQVSVFINHPVRDASALRDTFLRELKLRGGKIDFREVQSWLSGKSKELQAGEVEKINTGQIIDISFNKKNTKALLSLFPDLYSGKLPSASEIKKHLSQLRITHGIREELLEEIQTPLLDLVVAETSEAINGEDAVLRYKFDRIPSKNPKIKEDGRADYYNVSTLQNAVAGQVLVEKIPATSGIDGITIFGEVLKSQAGKDIKLPVGKNTAVSEDGLHLIAQAEGLISTGKNQVSVLPVYEIPGDVDFSTGNIDFVGNVIVKGNLREGFSISSGGDVYIMGIVEGGHIEARGNIFIKNGVRGMHKSKIYAKGNFTAGFVENAKIRADVDVLVEDAIMHSDIMAGESIIMQSEARGFMVGGRYRAGKSIQVRNVGNRMATLTQIEIGLDPAIKAMYLQISEEYKGLMESIRKSNVIVRLLEDTKKQAGELSPEKQEIYEKVLENLRSSKEKISDLKKEIQEISEKLVVLQEAFITVEEAVNAGVVIQIGDYTKKMDERTQRVKIHLEDNLVKLSPL